MSVSIVDRFHSDSILHRRRVVADGAGLVELSQDLGQHFSVAGIAVAGNRLVLREAPRRPRSLRIVAYFTDRAPIRSRTPRTRWPLTERHRTSCGQCRIDVGRRDLAYAGLA